MKKFMALLLALLMMFGTLMVSFAESEEMPTEVETPADAVTETGKEENPPAANTAGAEENKPEEKPAEKPKQPAEKPAEQPEEKPAEKPEQPAEKPAEQPEEKPAEEPAVEQDAEEPAEQTEEQPAERPEENPTEQPVEQPEENPTEQPVEQPEEQPTEQPAEQTAEQTAEQPAEEPAEQPGETPAEQPEETRFTEGYILLKKGTVIYAEANSSAELGKITENSFAYAALEEGTERFSVVFDTENARKKNAPVLKGYVQAGKFTVLAEKDVLNLEQQLAGDTKAREYQGHRIPMAQYAAAEQKANEENAAAAKTEATVSCTPAVLKIKTGEIARFYAVVKNLEGEIAYQWQVSRDGGVTWSDFENQNKRMLSFEVTNDNFAEEYRCEIRADGVSMLSPIVTLSFGGRTAGNDTGAMPSVSIDPKKGNAAIGSTVVFTATVTNPGSVVNYQWQCTTDGGKTWQNIHSATSKTNQLSLKVNTTNVKFNYRCVIKSDGVKAISGTSMIFAAQATASASKIDIGKEVKYTVKAYRGGKTLKYQWQYSLDEGVTWKNATSSTGNKTATLTITTNTTNINMIFRCVVSGGNGKVITNSVKVTPNPRYFALVVANSEYHSIYANDLPGVKVDGGAMNKALKAMGWKVKLVENTTYGGVDAAIRSYFKGKLKTDVCLFYFSGHGDASTGIYAGSLYGLDLTPYTPAELRNALLESTQGQVIILLDSCGSGAGVYSNGTKEKKDNNPRNFTEGVMNAFSGYLGSSVKGNTGELLNSRFAVLAACKYGGTSDDGYYVKEGNKVVPKRGGAFTYSLVSSMGCSYPGGTYGGKISADANGDRKLTLQEAYNGIKNKINYMNSLVKNTSYSPITQAVQMGGSGSTVLFKK